MSVVRAGLSLPTIAKATDKGRVYHLRVGQGRLACAGHSLQLAIFVSKMA